jgi:hypothetical protein
MKGIKLTPLLLFVLLLVVLVISVVFGKMGNMEGFISFQKDKASLDKVWIPQYSKVERVHKLNDNMFFDSRNGNLIELDAEEYSDRAIANTAVDARAATNKAAADKAVADARAAAEHALVLTLTTAEMAYSNAKNDAERTAATTARTNATNAISTFAAQIAAADKAIADKAAADKALADAVTLARTAVTAATTDAARATANATLTAAMTAVADRAVTARQENTAAIATATAAVAAATNDIDRSLANANLVYARNAKTAADDRAAADSIPNAVTADTTGVTITRVIVNLRTGQTSKIYPITIADITPRDTVESQIVSVSSSYKSWKYESQCANTSRKTVFYIPWKENTYIIIVDKTANNPYSLYMFEPNNDIGQKTFSKQEIPEIYSQTTLDEKTNSTVSEPLYKNQMVYKISKEVEYDVRRGNTIILPSTQGGQPNVYSRAGILVDLTTVKPGDAGNISNLSFSPWIIKIGDKPAGFCMPHKDNTVICILSDNGTPSLINVKRFTKYGVDLDGTPQQTTDQSSPPSTSSPPSSSGDDADGDLPDEPASSDYILKTQIVPPVCPTCPACPGTVTCTNCGGHGGSGTLMNNGNSIVGDKESDNNGNRRGGLARQVINDTTGLARDAVAGADDLVRDAASGTAGLAKDAVGGTVGLAKDAVGGTLGLAKDAVGGTVGLAKDVVGGTVGLAKDTVSGATGLLTGAVSGVTGLFKPNPTQIQNNTIGNSMQSSSNRRGDSYGGQTVDNTTYYGALPDRPSANYMPVTADFSAFSR